MRVTRHVPVFATGLLLAALSASAQDNITTPVLTVGAPTNDNSAPGQWQIPLSWTPISGAQTVFIEFSLSPTFGTTSVETPGTATTRTVGGLTSGATYYFRIYGLNRNPYDAGGRSNVVSATYTVIAPPPTATPAPPPPTATPWVTLIAPANVTIGTPVAYTVAGQWKVTLSWTAVPKAQVHQVQYTSDPNFYNPTSVETTGTSATPFGMSNYTKYYFRVYGLIRTPSFVKGPDSTVVSAIYPFGTPTPAPPVSSIPTTPTGCGAIKGNAMSAGQYLTAGQKILSPNLQYRLVYQTDGNLVLYKGTAALWAINKIVAPGVAMMRTDGNLTVYNNANAGYYSSGTTGKGGTLLSVQDDGNLVMYKPSCIKVWSRLTGVAP